MLIESHAFEVRWINVLIGTIATTTANFAVGIVVIYIIKISL